MFKNKRRGEVRVSIELAQEKKIMAAMFAEFTPVIASINFNRVVYSGFCDQFREVEDGEQAPVYDFWITKNEDETYTIKEITELK